MNARTRRRLFNNLSFTVFVSSLMALALINGLLRPLQLQSSDLLFRLKQDSAARWSVIVAIDDRSLAELRSSGRFFNWPRQYHATVVDNLKAAGARVVVLDILFDASAEGDAELAESIRNAGNVVLAETLDPATALPPTPERRFRYEATIEQLPAFREGALAIGHANQFPDSDGAIRATPLLIEVAGQELPSLPLVAAGKFLRRPQVPEAPVQNGKMAFAGREIPVDQDAKMWISYLADSSEVTDPPTFPRISYVDALNNNFPPELVRSKLVFVGITALGFADDFWTPVSRFSKMDGVEIHANAFETIMRPDQFIVPASPQLTILLIYLAGLIAVIALSLLSPLPAVGLGLLVGFGYLIAAVLSVDRLSVILDLSYPLLSLGLCYLTVLMYRVVFEQAQQRALKGAMSQYLSPDVMEEVVRDPGALKLGGEKREMTVLFSDIRGFTSFSETLEPERLVQLLNVYLTRMSDIIFKHQGTVDKYMGDAIMAFWGAPKRQPDHARLACLAAIEMVEELQRLNEELARDGLPPFNMGIGLNTGPMAVGNMGSEKRFDYTVLGDAVNLGSRLEALNKEYGTTIIVAESTLMKAGSDIRARFVDLVAVKGKSEPAAVYELYGLDGKTDHQIQPALQAYTRGLECYRAGEYAESVSHFEEALRFNPKDTVSAVYLERSRELVANPPPADWDGVYVMQHK